MATNGTVAEQTASTTMQEPAAGGFVGRFGLDPWLLLAQVINFLILLVILSRFVFWPLLKVLRERTANIAQGLADAEAAAAIKVAAGADRQRVLAEAAREAARKLRATEEEAHRVRARVVQTAEEEAEAMHDRATREAEQLTSEALRAATGQAGDLIVDALERVLASKLTDKERAQYREAALKALHAEAS